MELWPIAGAVVTLVAGAVLIINIVRDYRDPYGYQRLSRTIREMAHEQARMAMRQLEMETLLAEFEFGTERLLRFIEQKGWTPPWRPTRAFHHIANGGSRLLPLYELFYERFSDDELFDLAFRVGIKREEVAGDTHSGRAQSLIEYAVRRDLIDDLVRIGRTVRPELEWPNGLESR